MNVGIDKISFYSPAYYIDMTELADIRKVDPAKFHVGIGQDQMALAPKTQDIVTFAANAAQNILGADDLAEIDTIIVATESGIDESKASAVILHRLLGIQPFARAFEIKEACYGATAGLQFAKEHVALHPDKKVLVIASDIAKYGLKSGGEPTQGAGAVAMLVSADPKILTFEDDNVMLTQDIYDFWRPVGYAFPLVDGPLSNETYIQSFQKIWEENKKQNHSSFSDYAALTFHIPYTKMGKKALKSVLKNGTEDEQNRLLSRYEESIVYSKKIGNMYTGSLYLGLISLLENSTALQENDRIGLFSYGSGSVAEFFSMKLVKDYQKYLKKDLHEKQLAQRTKLSIGQYEEMFSETLDTSEDKKFYDKTPYSISEIKGTIRHYNE
ncbi:hydroxymethylglutaryl-CoA synthase [Tetragenococcus halophilus]|uniref:3-hydroxy-3-methylglutaryl-CoA synthase n=1 Tax=Tetragenococcus halophilus subsp. halophilus TaxID=1513897 RepID=A0A2H6CWI9_TETHA|nr:hydroxymethylglutaryl-CoA synthase [Tetragenococcus halophilus]GBD69344.1 3-hydroxy-3-methylglutaryl-CoA synthase [Tetragenococcus halophilus subsp. halophilus]GEQ38824.1 hydroxymethylglutaryl-CoA synthase [Tetragenococcus halophilus]GEQ41096.1 hydroxymethylglutaryl-CoA synthase [Tetragenococcus halophilus]GEQ43341.1 hydroxymethylglutaryl-CoA synthase [Tetragenococcus halophilus]GEQ45585.1 hydroxymethylglutaryl-CoA synthase [Tetragenococcus halophilus]